MAGGQPSRGNHRNRGLGLRRRPEVGGAASARRAGRGALVQLQFALNFLANNVVLSGDLPAAVALLEEDRLVSKMTGVPPIAFTGVLVEAFRGNEERTSKLVASTTAEHGQGRIVDFASYAAAVLYNGIGRHERVLEYALRVFESDVLGYQTLVLPELAEAASRTDNEPLLRRALAWVSACSRVTPTAWALAAEARVCAFASEGAAAEAFHRDSIGLLETTSLRVDLARGHLLYGEWLRREGRRGEARHELRLAEHMLAEMGIVAFAERARRELLATGERLRKRTTSAAGSLTTQEVHIARLVQQGLSNPEIGTRLFLSARTVEWHLRNVFGKVGISSRRQLRDVDLDAHVAAP